MHGAVDCHIHTAPDVVPRKLDDLEMVRRAKQAGLQAVVIKSHLGDTAARAAIAAASFSEVRVFGGVALNRSVGGLNPRAVEVSLQLGGKMVWMPTVDAAHHRFRTGRDGGINVLDPKGRLKPEAREILQLARDSGAALCTGHLSPREIHCLISAAKEESVASVVVSHPEFWITYLSLAEQSVLLEQGVFFERCYYASTLPQEERTDLGRSISWVKSLGAGSTILASDLGQAHNISPLQGLETMLQNFLQAGFSEADVRCMVRDNPRRILGLG